MLYYVRIKRVHAEYIMARKPLQDYVTVDQARFLDTIEAYFSWKDLNSFIKSSHSRGLNFPEIISESLLCYVLDYRLNRGTYGDAIDHDGNVIECKATSNWDRDTSSFGPVTTFDRLIFIRLNMRDDFIAFYDLNLTGTTIRDVPVNATQSLGDQQDQGRRPRFSIINKIIEPLDLQPIADINLRTQKFNVYI